MRSLEILAYPGGDGVLYCVTLVRMNQRHTIYKIVKGCTKGQMCASWSILDPMNLRKGLKTHFSCIPPHVHTGY